MIHKNNIANFNCKNNIANFNCATRQSLSLMSISNNVD